MFVFFGFLSIAMGLLIFIFPELLAIIVGTALVLLGIAILGFTLKLKKYSKINILK